MPLIFLSRHMPTAAQAETVRERFGELIWHESSPILVPGRVSAQVAEALNCTDTNDPFYDDRRVVAGVFPGWALIELLRDGWTVIEFVNEPDARNRGAFICRGAFVHRVSSFRGYEVIDLLHLSKSEFLTCPVVPHDNESV